MSVLLWFLQSFGFEGGTFGMVSSEESSILGFVGGLLAPLFAPLGFGTWQAAVALLTGLVAKEMVVSSMSMFYGFSVTASGAAIAAALGGTWTFTGSGRLPQRPLDVYRDLLPGHGVSYRDPGDDSLPLTIAGQLTPGAYQVPGNISSQFITGLLLALPLLPGDSDILLTTPWNRKVM